MSLLPRTEDNKVDYKSMWEVKLLKIIFKTLAYILFIVFILTGTQSAWKWSILKYHGQDFSIERLAPGLEALTKNDPDQTHGLNFFIAYPPEKTDDMIAEIEHLAPKLNAPFFFVIASRYWALKDFEQAFFWTTVARYRLRFDALRCDYLNADITAKNILGIFSNPDIDRAFNKENTLAKKQYLQRAIDWDKKYPAINAPRYFCDFIETFENKKNIVALPKHEWETIRTVMHSAAEAHIDTQTKPSETEQHAE